MTLAPSLQLGESANGVAIIPDTVPDVVSAYFAKLKVGMGHARGKLKLLDEDIRLAILAAHRRPPTLGELMVLSTVLRCELEILLCENWCRAKENKKDLRGQIDMAERQRKASIERDKHFEKLGLGQGMPQTSLAAILYGRTE